MSFVSFRMIDSDVEIPIWYNGKIKWISNLTRRSTCEDVIKAILSSDGVSSTENSFLFESWRGVERPLKLRCRLLKLWHSWAGEATNVTLTLRHDQAQTDQTAFLLFQQEKKLKKLKKQMKKTDSHFEKYSHRNHALEDEYQQTINCYIHLYRSILHLQKQIEAEEKSISTLIDDIQEENSSTLPSKDFLHLLSDVNQTLIISRKLTEQSEQLDEQIQKINDEIDRRQNVLDELELDEALEQNIDLDSLDDEQDELDFSQHQSKKKSSFSSSSDRWTRSPSPPAPQLPQKIKTGSFPLSLPLSLLPLRPPSLLVHSRPTAIVEPNFSSKSSSIFDDRSMRKSRLEAHRPSTSRSTCTWSISTNDESDTGISSFNSGDDQLITLV